MSWTITSACGFINFCLEFIIRRMSRRTQTGLFIFSQNLELLNFQYVYNVQTTGGPSENTPVMSRCMVLVALTAVDRSCGCQGKAVMLTFSNVFLQQLSFPLEGVFPAYVSLATRVAQQRDVWDRQLQKKRRRKKHNTRMARVSWSMLRTYKIRTDFAWAGVIATVLLDLLVLAVDVAIAQL